jgi:hypothetical protein
MLSPGPAGFGSPVKVGVRVTVLTWWGSVSELGSQFASPENDAVIVQAPGDEGVRAQLPLAAPEQGIAPHPLTVTVPVGPQPPATFHATVTT